MNDRKIEWYKSLRWTHTHSHSKREWVGRVYWQRKSPSQYLTSVAHRLVLPDCSSAAQCSRSSTAGRVLQRRLFCCKLHALLCRKCTCNTIFCNIDNYKQCKIIKNYYKQCKNYSPLCWASSAKFRYVRLRLNWPCSEEFRLEHTMHAII